MSSEIYPRLSTFRANESIPTSFAIEGVNVIYYLSPLTSQPVPRWGIPRVWRQLCNVKCKRSEDEWFKETAGLRESWGTARSFQDVNEDGPGIAAHHGIKFIKGKPNNYFVDRLMTTQDEIITNLMTVG